MQKIDYKKEYKDLYMPKNKPSIINVPPMNFLMLNGKGDPNDNEYQEAVQTLYSLAYTIKMDKDRPDGYFDYVVPPLEGLWWSEGPFDLYERKDWLWTSMIRQPEFVTQSVLDQATEKAQKKNRRLDFSKVKLEIFTEGLCVQMMHIGPFADEPASIKSMMAFISSQNFKDAVGAVRKHHEIYLSDPRKTASDKLRTVLRHPIDQI